VNCESVTAVLSSFIDGELCVDDMRNVQIHLLDCPECWVKCEQLRSQSASLQNWITDIRTPSELSERVMAGITNVHRVSQARWLATVYAVFTLIIVCLMGLVLTTVFGVFVRAITRLSLAATHSLLMFASTVGANWLLGVVVLCAILGGLSIVGVIRLLRSPEAIA